MLSPEKCRAPSAVFPKTERLHRPLLLCLKTHCLARKMGESRLFPYWPTWVFYHNACKRLCILRVVRFTQPCKALSLRLTLWPLSFILSIPIAGWSSSVARRAHNPKVIGSNPIPATNADNGSGQSPWAVFVYEERFSNRLLTSPNEPSSSSTCCLVKSAS